MFKRCMHVVYLCIWIGFKCPLIICMSMCVCSDLLNVPRDAYHRTHRDSSWTSSSSPVPEKRDSERENR